MQYDSFRYLFPPRPERKIAPTDLRQFEKRGWWAQAKFDGTNCTLYVAPNRVTIQRGRHGDEAIKNWEPGERWNAFARSLPGDSWWVFVAELLHTKGTGRDTVVLHDMLVADGEYLVGHPYQSRHGGVRQRLHSYTSSFALDANKTIYGPGLWLANCHAHSFTEWFDAAPEQGIEGLVFKNPAAPLMPCVRKSSNAGWQVKCRLPTANKSF